MLLKQQINVSNQNLKAAVAQYQESRAALRYVRADYYPDCHGVLHRRPGNSIPTTVLRRVQAFDGLTFNDFVVPVNFSYQVNVWGRVSRNVESYESRRKQRLQIWRSSISACTRHSRSTTSPPALWTPKRSCCETRSHSIEQAWQLNEDRYQGGLGSEVEVEQARTILETTRAQLVDVGVARAQYEHAAAVLIGKAPADFTLPPLPLTTPPPPIPVGVPSELLERRPDIAAAERRVASANAQVGLARDSLLSTCEYHGLRRIREREHHHPASRSGCVVVRWSVPSCRPCLMEAAGGHSTIRPGRPTTPLLRRTVKPY